MKYLLLSRTNYSVNATGHTSCFDTLLPSNRASFIQAASSNARGGEGGKGLCGANNKVENCPGVSILATLFNSFAIN